VALAACSENDQVWSPTTPSDDTPPRSLPAPHLPDFVNVYCAFEIED
jgi:hypothetical protein